MPPEFSPPPERKDAYEQPAVGASSVSRKRFILLASLSFIGVIIVAVLVIFGVRFFQHWQIEKQVTTAVQNAARHIGASKTDNGTYSQSSSDVKNTTNVHLSATISLDGEMYCVTGVSAHDKSVVYHQGTGDKKPQVGSCEQAASSKPGVPSHIMIASVDTSSVTLSWHADPYATSYELQCSVAADFSNATSAKTTKLVASVTKLQQDTEYYCRVRSVNKIGTSEWSMVQLKAKTLEWSYAPSTMTLEPVSATTASYSFPAVAGALYYHVQYSLDHNFVKGVKDFTTTATSGTVSGLEPGGYYTFQVQAITKDFDQQSATYSGEFEVRLPKP